MLRWQGAGIGGGAGRAFVAGLVGIKVKDKMGSRSVTGGNRCALPAHTPGRCVIEIGAMVFGDRCAGSFRMVSRFPL